jgi:hypothetical protein
MTVYFLQYLNIRIQFQFSIQTCGSTHATLTSTSKKQLASAKHTEKKHVLLCFLVLLVAPSRSRNKKQIDCRHALAEA